MVPCIVSGHIPYLCVGDPRCALRLATAADYVLPMPAHLSAVGIDQAVDILWAEEDRQEIHALAASMPSAPARRDLGKEASHLSHLLTHMPANPHCEACIRAKMKQAQHRRGGYAREPARWGELLTCDHLVKQKGDLSLGITEATDALVVKDLFTQYVWVYPITARDKDETVRSLKDFAGMYGIDRVYSDNSLELIAACKELRWPRERSQSGVPQTNGIIERTNGVVLAMTRTALVAAGLPNHFWPYAVQCTCFNWNTGWTRKGPSPWMLCHGSEIEASRLPFGCLVYFLQSPTVGKKQVQPKWGPRAVAGVFAGYVVAPSCGWSGRYLVWELQEFVRLRLNLKADASAATTCFPSPHDTAQIHLPTDGSVFFPC